MPASASGNRRFAPLRGFRESWILYRVVRRCGGNPVTLVRWLDRTGRAPDGPDGMSALAHRLAPWTWGHRCLYDALLRYRAREGGRVLNIGLTYRFAEAKFGHCWVSTAGSGTDEADRDHARFFSRPLARRGAVAWWLPSDEFGAPAVGGRPALAPGKSGHDR